MAKAIVFPKCEDTSFIGLFRYGFECGVAIWESGRNVESITYLADTAAPKDRGMIAACEIIGKNTETAEREARAHGMTHEEAARFVRTKEREIREIEVSRGVNCIPSH